jgi:ribosome maturation factor RimP
LSKITEIVASLAEPVVKECGCELWDVEYIKEAGEWFLRVYIDKEGGVSINDCVAVTHALDPILDERDLIQESYTFEVSSAGVERRLRRDSDFERFMGAFCAVRLYKARDGKKEHVGYLSGYNAGDVTIKLRTGEEITFTKAEVASVQLRIE